MDNFAEITFGQLAKAETEIPPSCYLPTRLLQTGAGISAVKGHCEPKPPPDTLNMQQATLKAELSSLSGREFDSLYIHGEIAHDTHCTLSE